MYVFSVFQRLLDSSSLFFPLLPSFLLSKRGDSVWKAAVHFFMRGSVVFAQKRKSSLSAFGSEALGIVTAEELKRIAQRSISKKTSSADAAPSSSRAAQPIVIADWLHLWIEAELERVRKAAAMSQPRGAPGRGSASYAPAEESSGKRHRSGQSTADPSTASDRGGAAVASSAGDKMDSGGRRVHAE